MASSTATKLREAELAEQLALKEIDLQQHQHSLLLAQEALAELELALEDTGWLRMSLAGAREFSIEGLRKLRRIARFMYLKNPLIRSAVRTTVNYVWGQGVSISGHHELVNQVVQAFLEDRHNAKELTGHKAQKAKTVSLLVEGELFLALFVNISTGFVRVRSIPPDEIVDIITDPEDQKVPWFYKRGFAAKDLDMVTGEFGVDEKVVFYPDWAHRPSQRPPSIGGVPVLWDAPVYHVKTGGMDDMVRGVPEIYAAMDWARAVKDDLENYSTIRKALTRFAMNLQVKGGKQGVAAAKTRLATTLDPGGSGVLDTNPPATAGSTFISTDGATLEPIKTSGAQPSPDEGRRLGLMVSAGTGVPETMLLGDANVGNLATAKTLDRPTELMMEDLQTEWADIYSDLLDFVVNKAMTCASGPLPRGFEVEDPYSGEPKLIMPVDPATGEPLDVGIDIKFPSVLQRDPENAVTAIVKAATLGNTEGVRAGLIDDRTLSRLLLDALGETEIDEMLAELYPDNAVTLPAVQDVSLVAALREVRDVLAKRAS